MPVYAFIHAAHRNTSPYPPSTGRSDAAMSSAHVVAVQSSSSVVPPSTLAISGAGVSTFTSAVLSRSTDVSVAGG
jgi:hypothetical protein